MRTQVAVVVSRGIFVKRLIIFRADFWALSFGYLRPDLIRAKVSLCGSKSKISETHGLFLSIAGKNEDKIDGEFGNEQVVGVKGLWRLLFGCNCCNCCLNEKIKTTTFSYLIAYLH